MGISVNEHGELKFRFADVPLITSVETEGIDGKIGQLCVVKYEDKYVRAKILRIEGAIKVHLVDLGKNITVNRVHKMTEEDTKKPTCVAQTSMAFIDHGYFFKNEQLKEDFLSQVECNFVDKHLYIHMAGADESGTL